MGPRRQGGNVTIPPDIEAKIRRLHFVEHWPVGTIEAQLGTHHSAVRRVLGIDERSRTGPTATRPRATDPFLPFIHETLKSYPSLRCSRLFDMIKDRGFKGSERRLRAVVAEVRPPKPREVYAHLDMIAGEQSQIDWAHLGRIKIRGAERDLWLFLVTLSWSRGIWGELVMDLGSASLRRSLIRAGRYFEGVTRQWLFDNPRTVGIGRDGSSVRFNPELLELAAHYHVEPRVCVPRKANQKGRVERTIRYLRDRHFAGRSLPPTIEDGNRQLLRFIAETANARPHPDHPERSVGDLLAEEKARLLPLPTQEPSMTQLLILPLDKYGYVAFDRNRYAVPDPDRSTITLIADEKEVSLSDGIDEVARYARSYGRRERIGRINPTPEGKITEPHSVRERLRSIAPAIDDLFARWLDLGLNIGSVTGRAAKIAGLYGHSIFKEAVEEMVEQDMVDLGALEVICDRLRRLKHERMPVHLELGPHVPERDVELTALEVFDER